MKIILGLADSQDTIHAHLGPIALYHGADIATGVFAFAAVPRDGAHEALAALDADTKIILFPDALDAAVTDAVLLKKLSKAASRLGAKGTTVRDFRNALHALGITHLFDPRLG